MQRLFSAEGPWPTPWMHRVLPIVTELASRHPERTVFTRFIPPMQATDMPGMWQRLLHALESCNPRTTGPRASGPFAATWEPFVLPRTL
jgi:nicotinamidase-related amidase